MTREELKRIVFKTHSPLTVEEVMFGIDKYVEQIRADAIEGCADKFADILSDIPNLCGTLCPVKCNWGTKESCKSMCKKWLLERLKEQNNE